MKYFIAHLLSGGAKEFHHGISRDLSLRYHTIPLHERIPPHITIKAPFETDESGIEEVERVVRALSRSVRAAPLSFSGFGRFGFRTVYMDVAKSPEAVALVRGAIKIINENIPWMPHSPLEGNKLHASVARFLTRKQSRRILRHLRPMGRPEFRENFDNIAILKKENKIWKVHTCVSLPLVEEAGVMQIFQEDPVLV